MFTKEEIEAKAKAIGQSWVYENTQSNNAAYMAANQMASWMLKKIEEDRPQHSRYEYVVGKEPIWKVGDILEDYEFYEDYEGYNLFGTITKVEFDDYLEDWVYTFKKGTCDTYEEQESCLLQEEAYTISKERLNKYWKTY